MRHLSASPEVETPNRLSPWLIVGVGGQFVGYWLLWIVLHLPYVLPRASGDAVVEGLTTVQRYWEQFAPWVIAYPRAQPRLLVGCFALLVCSYGLTILGTRQRLYRFNIVFIVTMTVLIGLPLLVLPQLLSTDVYSYAMFGRIPLLYGGNPFIDYPAQFPHDPLLPLVAWKTVASVYGPAWIIAALPLTTLAELLGGSASTYVLTYKVVGLVCHLTNIVLIADLLRRIRPTATRWGVLLYAWHPLAMIEFVGSGHNDSFMLTLMLVALMMEVRQRRTLALLLLITAGLVKAFALLLVPLYALYVVRQQSRGRLRLFAKQVVLGIGLVTALYAPFWVGWQTFAILTTAPPLTIAVNGPAEWVRDRLALGFCAQAVPVAPDDPDTQSQSPRRQLSACRERITDVVKQISLASFAVIYVALALWPITTFGSWINRSIVVMVAYLLLAAIHYEPWYATWILALQPMMARPRHLLWLGACCMLLIYGYAAMPARVPLAFAPLLLLVCSEGWHILRPYIFMLLRIRHVTATTQNNR